MRGARVWKIALTTVAALIVLIAAAVLALRSSRFHRFLLSEAIQKAEAATGAQVEIGNFACQWTRLHCDVYHIVLHGTESASAPPLLQADHLGITLRLISIWEGRINLTEISITHPVIHYLVDASGRGNLPHIPVSRPGNKTSNPFSLEIGHFLISRGELYDNDQETPLQAELRGVRAQASFLARSRQYAGQLSYRDGRIQYGSYLPVQHDLDVQFAASPLALAITSLRLASGSSLFTAQGNLRDYSNPVVEASYRADLSLSDLARIMNNPALPSGAIATSGSFHYRQEPNQPLLEGISLQGQLSSPSLAIRSPEARAGIQSAGGTYSLAQGNLEVRDVRMDALGGHIAAQGSLRNLTGRPEGRLEASVHGISLQDMNAAITSAPLDQTGLSGNLDGSANASWAGSLSSLQVRADASITASQPVERSAAVSSGAIPIHGEVHASYDAHQGTISLRNTYFRTPQSSLDLEGTLASRSTLQIQAQSSDLHEIDVLALTLRSHEALHDKKPAPRLLGLAGAASFRGQLQGTTRVPRLSGQLAAENVSYEGSTLPLIRGSLEAGPSRLAVHQGQLRIASQGSVHFDGSVALADWSYSAQMPVSVQMTAAGVALQDLEHLANRQYPVSGTLTATLSFQGTEDNPSGSGLIRLSGGAAWGQPVQSLSVQFQGDGNSVRSTISLQTPAGKGNATVTLQPRGERYNLQAGFSGVRIEKLQLAQVRKLQMSGILNVTAQGQGSIKSPELEGEIKAPQLQIRQQNLDGLQVHVALAGQQANVTISSSLVGTAIQGLATVHLMPPYQATAHVDTGAIQLAPLLASALQQPVQAFRGQTALHAVLSGPLKDPRQLQVSFSMPYLSVGYQSLDLASTAAISAEYRDGVLTLPGADFKGSAMNLHVQGAVPVLATGRLQASAVGNVDLHIIQAALPGWSTSGQLQLNLTAQGSREHPDLHGSARITDAAIVPAGAPLGLQKLNADLDIQQDRLSIRSLSAQSGGGTITAQGFATYQPQRFNVALSAKDVRLSYPQGIRTVLESNLTLIGSRSSAVLGGQVLIDRISASKDFDVATLMDQFSGPSSPPGAGVEQNLQLNVVVRSTSQMDVSTSQLSIEGAVDLQVRGSLARPLILGRTEISSGELFFNGNRYQVQNGVVEFDNPTRTEPVLNMAVSTTINEYTVSIRFVGPLDHMRTTYTSDPPLAPVDVINLLVTGHPTEASSSSPSTPESVVAGQLAGQVSGRVEKLAGISSLTIDPQIGGSGTNAGTRLAVQQRVTKDLFFTFATNVSSTEDPLIQVEYQVTKRYSVSALRDQNGNYSLQIGMHKRF